MSIVWIHLSSLVFWICKPRRNRNRAHCHDVACPHQSSIWNPPRNILDFQVVEAYWLIRHLKLDYRPLYYAQSGVGDAPWPTWLQNGWVGIARCISMVLSFIWNDLAGGDSEDCVSWYSMQQCRSSSTRHILFGSSMWFPPCLLWDCGYFGSHSELLISFITLATVY